MNKTEFIKERTKEIFEFLKIKRIPLPEINKLESIIKIYKYVVQNVNPNSKYIESKVKNKQEYYLNSLLIALTNNPGLPSTNAILFKHLLDMCGVKNYLVFCKSTRTGIQNISNLVEIGKEFYYFEPSLERTIFEEKKRAPDKLEIICAALGSEDFEKLYIPIEVMENINSGAIALPNNIARKSKPKILIDEINTRISVLVENKNNGKIDESQEEIEIN